MALMDERYAARRRDEGEAEVMRPRNNRFGGETPVSLPRSVSPSRFPEATAPENPPAPGGRVATLVKPSESVAETTPRSITIGENTFRLPCLPTNPGPAYHRTKRTADVTIAGVLLFALFPLMLLVALAIYLEDKGGVFYYQMRVGRDGKHFRFYKFRSMVCNADRIKEQLEAQNEATGPIFKMKNDPRITRIGKYLRRSSMDELPQLFNVLRGEMSLIGPRPHLPREVALYKPEQECRLEVQPGLLCLREVLGRSNMTFEQWMELDLLYIAHRSFVMDTWILLRLIPAVLKAEGAY